MFIGTGTDRAQLGAAGRVPPRSRRLCGIRGPDLSPSSFRQFYLPSTLLLRLFASVPLAGTS